VEFGKSDAHLVWRAMPRQRQSALISPPPSTIAVTTSARWIDAIEAACSEPDPAVSNRRITRLHYLLSEELAGALGREGGPNFHSWAVWGSRKAGVTIRQEDIDDAIHNATRRRALPGA